MADLLPTLSSDDETNPVIDTVGGGVDDDSEDGDNEVNHDFEFGGILGEDGGLGSIASMAFGNSSGSAGWSYQAALEKLERSKNKNSTALPRMDVSSIIAAKRMTLRREVTNPKRKPESDEVDGDGHDQNEESEDDSEGGSESENENGSKSEGSGSEQSSSEDDDDNDEKDEVDDAKREMEQDILTTRRAKERKQKKPRGKESQLEQNVDNETKNDDADSGGEDVDEDDADGSDATGSDDEEDAEEAAKVAEFFEEQQTGNGNDDVEVFAQLTLSRPLLRGIAAMGYVKPTPIQASVIPVALAGRDICASAVTGSGKTAAFVLPILERLLHRPPGRIMALILTPTRELAAQCVGMMTTLSQFTKIQSALIVGGAKNVNAQIAELRARPQVVVATPGRLLDHVLNSQGVSLEDIEFLILDEADRLLDLGFQEEVQELIQACPKQRQTMLFSATMNTKVDDLIKLSLKRPVRLRISNKEKKDNKDLEVAPRLEQEFVRVRSGNEGINREGMLLALLTRTFSTQTIVFFDTKVQAHRMMILCGLCGIKCAELHGNLTQTQRLEALEQFRKGEVDILLATDLAARGLDISRVNAVVNFEMPSQVTTYIHRIGRTARAGRGGRSCTLIGEGRRCLMKQVLKDAAAKSVGAGGNSKAGVIRSRSIPAAVVAHFVTKIQSLEPHLEEVMQAEAVAKLDRLAEMEANKAENLIEHADEIQARPQRQWFASKREKQAIKENAAAKAKQVADAFGTGTHRMTRKKRRAREARQMLLEDAGGRDDGDAGSDDEDANTGPKRKRLPSVKSSARAHKREQEQKRLERDAKSAYDVDMKPERARKKSKGAKASDALGDSSLFSEELITHAPKKKSGEEERAKSNYNFRGFDPTKDGLRKKPKKKSVNKFKSKSKFKRR